MMPEPEPTKPKRIPLRHLPLFWIGLLPALILAWAWADAMLYRSDWTYCRDLRRSWTIGMGSGCFHIAHMALPPEPGVRGALKLTPKWGSTKRMREGARNGLFPPFQFERESITSALGPGSSGYLIVLPLLQLLLAWLPLWLGLSWWQARRKARGLREAAAEVAQL